MNKTKMTLAATGGACAVIVLAAAVFAWLSYSAKTAAIEGTEGSDDEAPIEGFESVLEEARTLSRGGKGGIYPCNASVNTIVSNREMVVSWTQDALQLASIGDVVFDAAESAPSLKARMRDEANELKKLPGSVGGMLAKPDFAFGDDFKDYIAGGKMPGDEAEAKAALQRQWYDISTIVRILSESGIAELTNIKVVHKEEAADSNRNRNNGNRNKGKNAKVESPADAVSYVFSFTTRSAGFVKSLNALATAKRYVVVDDFYISRSTDPITEALEENEEKRAAKQAGGRRRRGNLQELAAIEEEAENAGGIVTDPQAGDPFNVDLMVTVYDFRSKLPGKDVDTKNGGTRK